MKKIGQPVRTAVKYALLQIPSALVLLIVLLLLGHSFSLPSWLTWTILGLWIAKDAALYPLLRRAYEPSAASSLGSLQGARGTARQPLAPAGYILIRGELWQAEVQAGESVAPGEEVVVRGSRGLVLLVSPAENRNRPMPRT